MSLFDKLFAKQEDTYSDFDWIPLIETDQLNEIAQNSKKKLIAIFKHSTRCGVSRSVLKQFEKEPKNENIDFYYLDLLKFREISNEIAVKFKIQHQSPQLIVFKDENVVANASHYSIVELDLNKFS